MNDKRRHIQAFTMVDILTGMVMTSIIIGMVFYVFTSLNEQFANYTKTRAEINAYLLLKADLSRHFEAEDHACYGMPLGMNVKTDTTEIEYRREGELLLREINGVRDTLSRHLTEFEVTYFLDAEEEPTNRVASLRVSVNFENQALSAAFYKRSGTADHINKLLSNEL